MPAPSPAARTVAAAAAAAAAGLTAEGAVPGCQPPPVEPTQLPRCRRLKTPPRGDHPEQLAAQERLGNSSGGSTLCDSLMSPMPGLSTFAINQETLAGVLTVTDAEVKAAMRFAFERLKLVVEPGGSVGLAAALAGKLDLSGKRVGIVLSGGNVDPGQFAQILAEG